MEGLNLGCRYGLIVNVVVLELVFLTSIHLLFRAIIKSYKKDFTADGALRPPHYKETNTKLHRYMPPPISVVTAMDPCSNLQASLQQLLKL